MARRIHWLDFAPAKLTALERAELFSLARVLRAGVGKASDNDAAEVVEGIRRLQAGHRGTSQRRLRLNAASHVLCDLAKQGWAIKCDDGCVRVGRPLTFDDPELDRARIRRQLHAERDDQLREPSVRKFISEMEQRRQFEDTNVSIFSLMADGRDLVSRADSRSDAILPYVQVVSPNETCSHTGLRLIDIWRYFRHTWATPYQSVPGRTLMLLVRDAAAKFHPVMGIAALSSATVGLSVRDEYLGWTVEAVRASINLINQGLYFRWFSETLKTLTGEIFINDLLEDGSLTRQNLRSPTTDIVHSLTKASQQHRDQHYRFMQRSDYDDDVDPRTASDDDWEKKSRQLLFRSKREHELASLLRVRIAFAGVTAKTFLNFLGTADGKYALGKIVQRCKALRVGTAIADLSVCGAIAPYGPLVGGKLVAALATSPEVISEYQRRYERVPSIIASSMAARSVVRPAKLVFISTTSLYGKRPNQYDRISIPTEAGTTGGKCIQYRYLGKTQGVGTFQFGDATVKAIKAVISATEGGIRVNSLFGEGVSPRLRQLRDGLDQLGLRSSDFLDHGAPRLVYGVSLAENVGRYLLGLDAEPNYFGGEKRLNAEGIGAWWRNRWCNSRLQDDEVRKEVLKHTLINPVTHDARVKLPDLYGEAENLFGD